MMPVKVPRLRPPLREKAPAVHSTIDNVMLTDGGAQQRPVAKEFFCRQCDRRANGDIPAGWYRLVRRIVPFSLQPPPEFKRPAQPRSRRPPEMPMGLYCSITCLKAAIGRLTAVDAELTKGGIGLKALEPGSLPVKLPPVAKRGGI
jgi:hypothetical protein